MESFHGYIAPGVLLGGFMVNLAKSHIPPGVLYDAICETASCLPDAIQLLTPCTIGNAWLKIYDFGRYALTLYDKKGGGGVRVFLAPEHIEQHPQIAAWFYKLVPKQAQNEQLLLQEIKEAGENLCDIQVVQIKPDLLKKNSKGKIAVCPSCREAYPAKHGSVCRACQGNSPYLLTESPRETTGLSRFAL